MLKSLKEAKSDLTKTVQHCRCLVYFLQIGMKFYTHIYRDGSRVSTKFELIKIKTSRPDKKIQIM
jgi:ABC-type uncharacterized transport system substrate-binding protein